MDYCTVIKNDVGLVFKLLLLLEVVFYHFYGGEDLTQAFPHARSYTLYIMAAHNLQ